MFLLFFQISNGQLAVMTKTQVQLQNVTLNNCSEAYKFFLKITYEVDAIQHVLFHVSGSSDLLNSKLFLLHLSSKNCYNMVIGLSFHLSILSVTL